MEINLSNNLTAELQSIRDRTQSATAAHSASAASYGVTIVRSAIQVNALSLIAIPAYLLSSRNAGLIGVEAFIWPALCFVAGVISGGMCGFCAFRNFYHGGMTEANNSISQMTDAYIRNIENFSDDNPEWMDQYREAESATEEHLSIMAKYENRAVFFGVVSAITFFVGWMIAGIALLS